MQNTRSVRRYCEACGATYSPTDVINPVSALSGTTPVKASDHLFFQLSQFQDLLADWVSGDQLQTPIANKLREWIDAGLQDWDISRDAPYFGFEIPGHPQKYFYVWLDAPIGHLPATRISATAPVRTSIVIGSQA